MLDSRIMAHLMTNPNIYRAYNRISQLFDKHASCYAGTGKHPVRQSGGKQFGSMGVVPGSHKGSINPLLFQKNRTSFAIPNYLM